MGDAASGRARQERPRAAPALPIERSRRRAAGRAERFEDGALTVARLAERAATRTGFAAAGMRCSMVWDVGRGHPRLAKTSHSSVRRPIPDREQRPPPFGADPLKTLFNNLTRRWIWNLSRRRVGFAGCSADLPRTYGWSAESMHLARCSARFDLFDRNVSLDQPTQGYRAARQVELPRLADHRWAPGWLSPARVEHMTGARASVDDTVLATNTGKPMDFSNPLATGSNAKMAIGWPSRTPSIINGPRELPSTVWPR